MSLEEYRSQWGFGLEGVEPFAVYAPDHGHPHKDGLDCCLSYGYVTEDGHRIWIINRVNPVRIQLKGASVYRNVCIGKFYDALREYEKKSFVENIKEITFALIAATKVGS